MSCRILAVVLSNIFSDTFEWRSSAVPSNKQIKLPQTLKFLILIGSVNIGIQSELASL